MITIVRHFALAAAFVFGFLIALPSPVMGAKPLSHAGAPARSALTHNPSGELAQLLKRSTRGQLRRLATATHLIVRVPVPPPISF